MTKEFWLVVKRILLIGLTILAALTVLSLLIQSLNQPQVQSRLELYQTQLLLQASALEADSDSDWSTLRQPLIGNTPYATAQQQYEKAREAAQKYCQTLDAQISLLQPSLATEANPAQQQVQRTIEETNAFIDEVELKLGILQVQQEQTAAALETWKAIAEQSQPPRSEVERTAAILQNLWSKSSLLSPQAETQIQATLKGWFRDRALQKLYQEQDRTSALSKLQAQEQDRARQAMVKLAIIGGIPGLGGVIGAGLLLFIAIQRLLQKERSLLATNQDVPWETPWNGEVILQVLIVGFFFIGQFLLPLFFNALGLETASLSLRQQAVFVLLSYLLMMGGGLLILYLSLQPFVPLPPAWFNLKLRGNWLLWGLGGYLAAIPLVVLVSLINQQFWQGQGGSNPLLSLALQSQDRVALTIFFLTAAVAAPLFEEIMFRGFLLPSLTRYIPAWGAILASSFIFAIAHLSVSEIAPLTTLGIVLGVVYSRSRNLLAPILLHSLWNSGTLLTLVILGS